MKQLRKEIRSNKYGHVHLISSAKNAFAIMASSKGQMECQTLNELQSKEYKATSTVGAYYGTNH